MTFFFSAFAPSLWLADQALVVVDSNPTAGPLVDLSQIAPPVPVRKTLMVVNQV